jgi:hypothetical protein
VNLSTGRVLVIVALIVVGLAVLANGFSDSGSTGAALSPTPSGSGGHTTSTTPSPTSVPPSPTPPPQTQGVTFMAMNGTDVPGAGAAAQTKLTNAGYVAAASAIDAPTSGINKTIVYFRDDQNAPQNQSDANYVAYKMQPAGIRFAKPLVATQGLRYTSVYGKPLSNKLFGAYISDDLLDLSKLLHALEIELSATVFKPGSSTYPDIETWTINHFSRYMLASD